VNDCNCMTRCRLSVFVKIDGREYPAPTHFEGCQLHKKERFIRMEIGGASCVMTPIEAQEWADNSEDGDCDFKEIFLTQDQFDAMPEFQGF